MVETKNKAIRLIAIALIIVFMTSVTITILLRINPRKR